jgi:hypothetical protein
MKILFVSAFFPYPPLAEYRRVAAFPAPDQPVVAPLE